VRPVDDIASIAPRPVFIMHGTDDPNIPFEHGQQLYDAAGKPKELYIVPGGGHGGLMQINPAEYTRRVLAFLDTYLRASGGFAITMR
jgi:fermentation-respiration switch protein FrsA (DUF1100 family)